MVKSGLRTGLLRSHSNRGEWALDIGDWCTRSYCRKEFTQTHTSGAREDKPYGRALGQGHFGEKRQGSYGLRDGIWHLSLRSRTLTTDLGAVTAEIVRLF